MYFNVRTKWSASARWPRSDIDARGFAYPFMFVYCVAATYKYNQALKLLNLYSKKWLLSYAGSKYFFSIYVEFINCMIQSWLGSISYMISNTT